MIRRLLPTGALLLGACSFSNTSDGEIAWAMNWAWVTPTETGLEGRQFWEFYHEGWERDLDDARYACRVAQQVTGTVVPCASEGVPLCMGAYLLAFSPDPEGSDCAPDPTADDPAFEGPFAMAIGVLPSELVEDADFPENSMGWYTAWEDGAWDAYGWAFERALEENQPPTAAGWAVGVEYTLTPAFVWEL